MGNFAFPNLASGAAAPPAKTSASRGQVVFAGEEVTVTAAQLTSGALLGHVRVPKGAVIIGASLKASDIDTGTAAILALGDASDDDRLITGANVGQAGGVTTTIAAAGYGYQYADETLVQVKVTTAPGTAADGTITYGVLYVSP